VNKPSAQHSAKPEIFLKMIESYCLSLPKIELNWREPERDGWDAWGAAGRAGRRFDVRCAAVFDSRRGFTPVHLRLGDGRACPLAA
jgi:N6-adenosine-specific RNA methylase IME4